MASIHRTGRPGRPWRVYWREAGRQRSRGFRERRDAARYALRLDTREEAARCGTIALPDAIDAWIADTEATGQPATVSTYRSVAGGFAEAVGAVRVDRITQESIERWREKRLADGLERSTLRQYVRVLRVMFGWFKRRGWCATNPAASVSLKGARRRAPRWLEPPDVVRLLAELQGEPELRLVALFGVRAGLRAGEIQRLTWGDVSLDSITVRDAKAGKPRMVPLHPDIAHALAAWPRVSERLFPMRHKGDGPQIPDAPRRLNTWLAAHGYPVRLHGLRHTFASMLAEAGASQGEIRDVLGHTSIAMSLWYTHSREQQARAHVLALGSISGSDR